MALFRLQSMGQQINSGQQIIRHYLLIWHVGAFTFKVKRSSSGWESSETLSHTILTIPTSILIHIVAGVNPLFT